MTRGKMMGRSKWLRLCACPLCNGPRSKKAVRAEEQRVWKRDFLAGN